MTLSDNVVGAIEKTLLKTPAIYRYNELITKTFLATAGQRISRSTQRYFHKRTNKAADCCIVQEQCIHWN